MQEQYSVRTFFANNTIKSGSVDNEKPNKISHFTKTSIAIICVSTLITVIHLTQGSIPFLPNILRTYPRYADKNETQQELDNRMASENLTQESLLATQNRQEQIQQTDRLDALQNQYTAVSCELPKARVRDLENNKINTELQYLVYDRPARLTPEKARTHTRTVFRRNIIDLCYADNVKIWEDHLARLKNTPERSNI